MVGRIYCVNLQDTLNAKVGDSENANTFGQTANNVGLHPLSSLSLTKAQTNNVTIPFEHVCCPQ
jgi:hypothetical protein